MRCLIPVSLCFLAGCAAPLPPPADPRMAASTVPPAPRSCGEPLAAARPPLILAAAAMWTPPPPVPPSPPNAPAFLATPEPELASTGDVRVDAYRARLLGQSSPFGWRPYLARALAGVCFDRAILTPEAEPQGAAAYAARYLTPERIAAGRALYRELQGRAPFQGERKVPLEVLLAMWGVASDYGRDPPRFDPLQVQLVRGAYEQLSYPQSFDIYHAARIAIAGPVPRERARAYADGRLGQVRALPEQYLRWGADGDGDGAADIWGSRADVLATFDNMMTPAWTPGVPIVAEVEPLALDPAEPAQRRMIRAMEANNSIHHRQLRRADGRPWPAGPEWGGEYVRPFGEGGPAFLIGPNATPVHAASPFRDIYGPYDRDLALAVGLLADAIAGRPGPTRPIG